MYYVPLLSTDEERGRRGDKAWLEQVVVEEEEVGGRKKARSKMKRERRKKSPSKNIWWWVLTYSYWLMPTTAIDLRVHRASQGFSFFYEKT